MSLAHPSAPFTFSGLATGKSRPMGLCAYSVARLPTDPIGSTTVTMTNIVDGSSLQIESQDASTVFHNSVVSGTSKSVTLSVYAAGSALNSLRIKLRKGTASPFYIPWKTILTAAVGSTSIYVAQIPDE